MKQRNLIVLAGTVGLAGGIVAGYAQAQSGAAGTVTVGGSVTPNPTAAECFDKLKTLVGTWKGKASHGGEPFDTEVTYRLTGNGSALVETIMPGTDHEMVSVYTRDRDTLLMTHYCSLGNQPRMRCIPGQALDALKFEFIDGGNMASTDEMHMHSLVMKFGGTDKLTATWAMYNKGQPQDEAVFIMERVNGSAPGRATTPAAPKHDHGK